LFYHLSANELQCIHLLSQLLTQ